MRIRACGVGLRDVLLDSEESGRLETMTHLQQRPRAWDVDLSSRT